MCPPHILQNLELTTRPTFLWHFSNSILNYYECEKNWVLYHFIIFDGYFGLKSWPGCCLGPPLSLLFPSQKQLCCFVHFLEIVLLLLLVLSYFEVFFLILVFSFLFIRFLLAKKGISIPAQKKTISNWSQYTYKLDNSTQAREGMQ